MGRFDWIPGNPPLTFNICSLFHSQYIEGMQVFRLNDASQTFGGRASADHLGAITRNVPAVLLMRVRCCV